MYLVKKKLLELFSVCLTLLELIIANGSSVLSLCPVCDTLDPCLNGLRYWNKFLRHTVEQCSSLLTPNFMSLSLGNHPN